MDPRDNAGKLKRRDFLALGAAGIAGAALAGGSPLALAAETSGPPPTFHIFPGNYTWSGAVRGAIATFHCGGGEMGEVYKVCAALQGKAADNAAWFVAWNKMGEHVAQLADEAKAKGYTQTASGACLRAAHYIQIGELLRQPRTPETQNAYAHSVELFKKGIPDVSFLSVEPVEIPFEGDKSLPAYFVKRSDVKSHKWPTVVFFPGLDSTKEVLYFRGVQELIKRGMACLIVDAPGNGEAIRFRGMPARYDSEAAGSAAVDYLQKRPDVDNNRIAVMGVSLGGYFAPRAAAFDKRFKACVAWGAQWDYYSVWKDRVEKAFKSSLPVPGVHILWYLGVDNMDQALEKLKPFTLEGVAQRVQCPFLLTHGEKDAQISLDTARQEFAAVGSKDKTLKVFTEKEGGSEHCQGDNLTLGITYIADWFTEKLVRT